MEWNGMEVTLFGSDIGRNGIESFYNNITIVPLVLKNKKIIIIIINENLKGHFRGFNKNFIKPKSIPSHSSQF